MKQRVKRDEGKVFWFVFAAIIFLMMCVWMYIDSQKAVKAKREREAKEMMVMQKVRAQADDKGVSVKGLVSKFLGNPLGLPPAVPQPQTAQQPMNLAAPQISDTKEPFYHEAK